MACQVLPEYTRTPLPRQLENSARTGSSRPDIPEQRTVTSEIAGCTHFDLAALGECEHAIDRTVRAATDFRIDVDLVRADLEHLCEVCEAVHRHPGTMSAAFAG